MEEAAGQANKPEREGVRVSRRISRWLMIVPVIIVLFSITIFTGLKFFGKESIPMPLEKEKGTKKEKISDIGPMFPLNSFIVNLAESDGKRYLKITMEMELEREDISEEVEKSSAQIRDTILTLLSSKTFADVKDVAGKYKLREQITARVNSRLKTGKIRQVYFTEFVIQ